MKLAKIEHYRCEQPAGKWGLSTYVWVSDTMTRLQLDSLVHIARDQYLEIEQAHKALTPVHPPGYGATILPNTPDNKTVGELKAEYEEKAKAYKAYQQSMAESRKSFTDHLIAVSNGTIAAFWNHEPDMSTSIDWGHNHGTIIDHGETKFKDYPPKDDDSDNVDEL